MDEGRGRGQRQDIVYEIYYRWDVVCLQLIS